MIKMIFFWKKKKPQLNTCQKCGNPLQNGKCLQCQNFEIYTNFSKLLEETKNSGLIVDSAMVVLARAYEQLTKKEYDSMKISLEKVKDIIGRIKKDGEEAKAKIEEAEVILADGFEEGLDVTSAKNMLDLSKSFFKRGKYGLAFLYAKKCEKLVEEARTRAMVEKEIEKAEDEYSFAVEEIRKAEETIMSAKEKNIDVTHAMKLLDLGKAFLRAKNADKAIRCAKKSATVVMDLEKEKKI
ncbi:MAG: hypothetical protein AB1779_02190 [Candidatus Thermoplasmatota archaeon]